MNKNTKIIWSVIVILIIIVGTSFAFTSKDNAKSDKKIKVGVILPLSGDYAAVGESVKNSMQLSYNELENKNVELVYEDGGFNSVKAVSAYKKLQDVDNVDIVIGLDSPTLESIKPVINKTDELLLTVGNESSIEKDNVFEVIPWATALFSELGKVTSTKNYSKVGIVYAKDWALAEPNKLQFIKGLGGQSNIEVPVSSNSDTRTEVTKMLQSGVDAYTLFLPLESGVKFLNEVARQTAGKNRPKLICDGNIELTIGDYLKKVNDKSVFEGCYSVFIADTTSKEYVEKYKTVYKSEPNFLAVYGYDAVKIISKELVRENKSDWKEILESKKFNFKGASGNITFDETGSRTLETQIDVYKEGAFTKEQ